jgi:hypothetical protein
MNYRILSASTATILEKNIKDSLNKGWKLQGGICVTIANNTMWHFQAITKE